MTDPDMMADRLAGNLDVFLKVHRADLIAMSLTLDIDVDLLLMDMMAAGFQEVKTRAMQSLQDGKYDTLIDSIKKQIGGGEE